MLKTHRENQFYSLFQIKKHRQIGGPVHVRGTLLIFMNFAAAPKSRGAWE